MITNGVNTRIKRGNSILKLDGEGGGPPPPFNIADLFTAGSDGFHMSVTDNVMRNSTDDGAAAVNGSVHSAYYTKYQGDGVPVSTDRLWNTTAANQPILRQDGSVKYLDFDGTSDRLESRSYVELASSDAVTIIAGVMRDQNVNLEDIAGMGSSPGNGSFRLCATYDANTDTAGFASRGTTDREQRISGVTVGNKYVLTGIGDISADLSIGRRNGVQIGINANDQGTGSYNDNILHVGSRGGTSRFFNGRLYALVIINRVLSGTELTNAEAWVASKTGVTI